MAETVRPDTFIMCQALFREFKQASRLKRKTIRIVLSVLLACFLSGCRGNRFESFYPTLGDAVKDQADERLWIPTFLPESSRNIHLLGELSPSREWCAFEFLPGDSKKLERSLKLVESLPPSMKHVPRLNRPWWPLFLEGDIDQTKLEGEGFHLYSAQSAMDREIFAIDWEKGRGYIYSPAT